MIVTKFGGTSLADATQVQKVFDIVAANPERRVVVASAPGKRHAADAKVTDSLIALATAHVSRRAATRDAYPGSESRITGANGLPSESPTDESTPAEPAPKELREITGRFRELAQGLGVRDSFADEVEQDLIGRLSAYEAKGLSVPAFFDLMKAAGEDNNAKLLAEFFRSMGLPASYVDPKDAGFILSDDYGNARTLPETDENVARALKPRLPSEVLVFPGFFGYTRTGKVITFSRGGSDITGSILAAALDADLYENFTDVSCVYAVDPTIVSAPVAMPELTYREMRELSYAGFNVYHEDALVPVFNKGITVRIKNTNDPDAPGTDIVPSRSPHSGSLVAGIAADRGFMSLNINKLLMNSEIGFCRKALAIVEDENLSFEHMPSGIDNVSVILRESAVSERSEARIVRRLMGELGVDDVSVRHGLAIVMLVGEGMLHNIGTTARASRALSSAKINIEIINQGASEVSLMFGVAEEDATRAVQSLYAEFFP